jgi:hypothetical protein
MWVFLTYISGEPSGSLFYWLFLFSMIYKYLKNEIIQTIYNGNGWNY